MKETDLAHGWVKLRLYCDLVFLLVRVRGLTWGGGGGGGDYQPPDQHPSLSLAIIPPCANGDASVLIHVHPPSLPF